MYTLHPHLDGALSGTEINTDLTNKPDMDYPTVFNNRKIKTNHRFPESLC